jgi:hypothetical protein
MAEKSEEPRRKKDTSDADALGVTASAVAGGAILGPIGALLGAGLALIGRQIVHSTIEKNSDEDKAED